MNVSKSLCKKKMLQSLKVDDYFLDTIGALTIVVIH